MLVGDFEHSLDDKNRVVLPSPLRRRMPGGEDGLRAPFYLVPSDEDECLELRPREDWEAYIQGLKRRHETGDRNWREFLRDLYSSACEVQLDKQYRFLLPEASKIAVGIERDVFFVGLGEFVEIWAKSRWESRKKERAGKRKTPSGGSLKTEA